MTFLCNDPSLKTKRRQLRRNQTDVERILWQRLRNKQLSNLRFFRQYSIGSYILDFYCPAKKLAIEVDGGQHALQSNEVNDTTRRLYLEEKNVHVLRFWNNEVLSNIDGVLQKIAEAVTPPASPLN